MARYGHHHHHMEWWLAPVYATVFMGLACWWILRLYALAFIYAWKGIRWAAPRITAVWRSWRAGTLGAGARRALARF